MDKALQYLGIARKAGLLSVGEEACSEAIFNGKARLVLLAGDASPYVKKRAVSLLEGRRAPMKTLKQGKAELGDVLGRAGCSIACLTDLGLAGRFAAAMAETDPDWTETASLLDARAEKAKRRRAAPRKHC